jgi:hypothetical protein
MGGLLPWLVVAAAGLGALLGIYLLTRPLKNAFFKRLLRCISMVWLLLPAPIPGAAGHFAPAYVVLIFEGLLQRDGQPEQSLWILAAGTLIVVVLLVGLALYGRRDAPGTADGAAP